MTNAMTGPVAKAQMLIRRPVADVFEALVDPAITSRFWFTRSSGRLKAGAKVRWDWEMYGVFAHVEVKAFEENKWIVIEWNGPDNPSLVEWAFHAKLGGTFVTVRNWGFRGAADAIVTTAIESTSGFSFVLAALKAYLEHGVELTLVADHHPAALVEAPASPEG